MAIEIHIEEDYGLHAKKIWITEKVPGKTIFYNVGKSGKIEQTEIDNSVPLAADNSIKPFMIMPAEFGAAFLLAFTKALTENGIRTDNEHKREGELIATKAHLKDMQDIVRKQLNYMIEA